MVKVEGTDSTAGESNTDYFLNEFDFASYWTKSNNNWRVKRFYTVHIGQNKVFGYNYTIALEFDLMFSHISNSSLEKMKRRKYDLFIFQNTARLKDHVIN